MTEELALTQGDLGQLLTNLGIEVGDDAHLDIPGPTEGKALLEGFEGQLFAGADNIKAGQIQMAYAMYVIVENKLWMYARDDRGDQAFMTQEAYLKDLLARGQAPARSSVFYHLRSMKIAVNGLGFEHDDIDKTGLTPFNTLKPLVEWDEDTGIITGLRDKELEAEIVARGETIQGYVRQAVVETSMPVDGRPDMAIPPRQIAKALRERLAPQKNETTWHLMPCGNGGYFLNYHYEHPGGYTNRGLHEGEPPQEVLEKLKSKLNIIS